MIGIDVSKESLAVCCWEPEAPAPAWEAEFPNSPEGLRALLAASDPEAAWVIEPTRPYSELPVRLGQAAGRQVLSASPYAAKRFLQSLNPRAKTDRVDARGLARYGLAAPLRPFAPKNPQLARLWGLLRVRCKLASARAALALQQQTLPEVSADIAPILAQLDTQLAALAKQIALVGKTIELFVRLDEIPGVGPLTATALTVRLLSLGFDRYDQFVAYIGLDLRVCESGSFRGHRKLSRRGDATLRWLLYLAARAALRSKDRTFRERYDRERAKGLTTTGALCAVARKLAKVAWSLAHTGECYRAARVSQALTPAIGP